MPDSRLVIFAHRGADSRWRVPFEELIANLAECNGVDKVRLAYMEFAQPSLSDIAQEASCDGKLHLRLLPMFLRGWSCGRRHSPAGRGRSDVFPASQD